MLRAVDSRILNLYEGFAHKMQRLVGLSCFRLGGICAVIWVAAVLVDDCIKLTQRRYVYWADSFVMLWFLAYAFWGAGHDEEAAESRSGLANPRKIDSSWRAWRILNLFLCGVSAAALALASRLFIWSAVYDFAMVSLLYFISCDPLPPAKSKLKEFLESGFWKPVPTPLTNRSSWAALELRPTEQDVLDRDGCL